MVRDYNFPLELRIVPIVREEDGLAKSSRNVYLSAQDRTEAPAIHAALRLAHDQMLKTGNVGQAVAIASAYIEEHTSGSIDYLQLLSYPDLSAINDKTEQVLLATAVYIGKTRLIDNVIFSLKGEKAYV